MDKWHLIVDVALCHHCGNCELAAKDELVGNDFPGYSAPHAPQGAGVVQVHRAVRGSGHQVSVAHWPQMCNHCSDAPCVKAGDGAVRQRDDGIVVFDPVLCKDRQDLVAACPYGAVVWNEAARLPQTWFFDAHLLDAGAQAPRCVEVCATGAIQAVKTTDEAMTVRAREEGLRVLQPELGTRPRVHYRNLHRADRCFIGGSVLARVDGVADCVAGAEVVLRREGEELARARTDAFGDFVFDDLPPDSGTYELVITHGPAVARVATPPLNRHSLVLGSLELTD